MGYEALMFETRSASGAPLYHTNVLLCIGARLIVVGTQSIVAGDRSRVLERLRASGREVIELRPSEIERFAGQYARACNLGRGARRLACARHVGGRACGAVDRDFRPFERVHRHDFGSAVAHHRALGGGGVRCMLAEVFVA